MFGDFLGLKIFKWHKKRWGYTKKKKKKKLILVEIVFAQYSLLHFMFVSFMNNIDVCMCACFLPPLLWHCFIWVWNTKKQLKKQFRKLCSIMVLNFAWIGFIGHSFKFLLHSFNNVNGFALLLKKSKNKNKNLFWITAFNIKTYLQC